MPHFPPAPHGRIVATSVLCVPILLGLALVGPLVGGCPAAAQSLAPATLDSPARPLVVSREIAAPVNQTWADWTTAPGIESFLAPKAIVEARPGGRYEVHFLPDAPAGERGSEGTHVLALQQERMLSVTWALPPYMPELRAHLTPLTVHFEPLDPMHSRLTIVHGGWGQGAAWDKARDYFEGTWPQVLEAQARKYDAP